MQVRCTDRVMLGDFSSGLGIIYKGKEDFVRYRKTSDADIRKLSSVSAVFFNEIGKSLFSASCSAHEYTSGNHTEDLKYMLSNLSEAMEV